MARRSRLNIPTAIHHVILRGNGGQNIFFSDHDRLKMLALLEEGCERFGHRIHAYCLMSNHIHLAIEVGSISLSRIMQNIAFRYTQYVNKQQNRLGHLFQGRFKSILVCGRLYFRDLVRYIHLNPVRAEIVSDPQEYLWSSHRTYLNLDNIFWITKNRLLNDFSNLSDYKNFILEGIGMTSEIDFKQGVRKGIIGDDDFIEETLNKARSKSYHKMPLKDLVSTICKYYKIDEEKLCDQSKIQPFPKIRALITILINEREDLSLTELGKHLKQDAGNLSKLSKRWQNHKEKGKIVNKEIRDLKSLLQKNY